MREPIHPKAQVEALFANVDAFDQRLDDARLLGREQLVSERVEVQQGPPHLILVKPSTFGFDARQVPTTISGARSSPRTWSITAASISAAGSRPTGQASRPCFDTAWLT